MKKKRPNPHCPVPGCKTDRPHAADPGVAVLIDEFAPPERMTYLVLGAMAELRNSIHKDFEEGHTFVFLTRCRQPEELYIRTLYALFIANEKELHHLLSGDMPIGFSDLYKKVNEVVLEGRGSLLVEQSGLDYDSFVPIEFLNDGAHVAFSSVLTGIALARDKERFQRYGGKIFKHYTYYFECLAYMHIMFKDGKSKADVLAGLMNLLKPGERLAS
jgi:hypothetical protein